jgi:type I restriction enzyme M protein
MLDVETKRRIDTARDILVGKVPDPKSQVEQITIALIYKFMDDMDNESIQLGGKKRFFTDEYEKYAWNKLLDPRMGGYEVLNLYAEAITKLNQNPNLPQLFREIFKNAYLPYRDPETLKMFLKTINEFSYEHSERLGDAFEYLLSVLSSQGDAGQFRTPRHIIDFMVEIVAPQKNEIILDPACGTAGFLISAYKYILRENTSEKYKNQNGNNGNYRADLLSVDDRKKLLDNFKGYDISPDMVRLSLVNMYLHGFVQPKIQEYDTLTSEDKWDERADVILANPPFMSPKGGIRPHKRFSVQSNRSEVLFVDYIAEHLTSNGRAAVIVPEGIVFRGDNAYKKLRKILVENYLYVVLSLPKGVFNPYADVKTSILLMDKQMVKKTDSILFVKIENDGFDLGDQRKPIDKNDLPDALKVIKEYVASVKSGKLKSFIAEKKPCSALLVQKEKIAENGEYNLTADRYRINEKIKHQKWEMVRLGEVCEFISGYAFKSENFLTKPSDNSYLPVIKIGNLNNKGKLSSNFEYYKYNNYLEKYLVKKGDILIAMTGATVGKTAVSQFDNCLLNQRVGLVRSTKKILQEYLRSILFSDLFYNYCQRIAGGGAQGNLSPNEIQNFPIPLPPIEIQKKDCSRD